MIERRQITSSPEHLCDGIAPEKVGNGTYDNGWKPGDIDENQQRVAEASEPGSPGIAPRSHLIDFGGIFLSREQAIALGFETD